MLNAIPRDPPQDVELEQIVLGSVLINNAAIDRLATLSPDDFSEGYNAALFAAMRDQWQEARSVNVVTLRGILADLPDLTRDVTPAEYVRRLLTVGDTRNIEALAERLREWANRRRLCQLAADLDATARHPGQSVQNAASIAVQALDDVLSYARPNASSRATLGQSMREALERMESDTGESRIPTGLTDLDRVTGGWRRKQFAIIAGRPSMGKSAVSSSAVIATARLGYGVLVFSMEMSRDDLSFRAMADLSWSAMNRIPYAEAMAGRLNDSQKEKWGRVAAHFEQLPLVLDDQRGLTMAEIAARTRAEAQRMERNGQRLGLVVVDHLGLIKPSGRYAGNKVNEVGEVSDALATLAKEQNVAVIGLHQLNRGTEARENKRPGLADLRNSGDLEQDADVVCFAYRESYYLERMQCDAGSQQEYQRQIDLEACRNSLELLVAKNRNGPTTTVHLFCDMACNAVRDAA
jgi:replicative DNA helicase